MRYLESLNDLLLDIVCKTTERNCFKSLVPLEGDGQQDSWEQAKELKESFAG